MHSCALFFYNCFVMSLYHYILHSFHVEIFSRWNFFSRCTLSTSHFFRIALFLFFVLHSFCVALSSCYIIFMSHFFRAALFSCCTFFLLQPFPVTLSLCCSFLVLHYFYDTLLSVNFFREGLPEKNFRGIASFAKVLYFFRIFLHIF